MIYRLMFYGIIMLFRGDHGMYSHAFLNFSSICFNTHRQLNGK